MKIIKKRLYVAYGSNLNLRQMAMRCPTAKLFGTGVVEGYELQFKGSPHGAFATIAPNENTSVPVAVWELKPYDEKALDVYEGYPSHYYKKDVPVMVNGQEITAMVYIMNQKMNFGIPSQRYYDTVYEGYKNCNLDTKILKQAVDVSTEKYRSALLSQSDEDEYDEKIDDDEMSPDEPDENDPFYFSDQISM